jgi:hypothetical protein
MNTYVWKIKNLDYVISDKGYFNVITNVHWSLTGSNGAYLAEVSGVQFLPTNNDKPFVAYKDLTEEIVINWLVSNFGEDQISSFKLSIDAEIEAQINPTTGNGLPWSK